MKSIQELLDQVEVKYNKLKKQNKYLVELQDAKLGLEEDMTETHRAIAVCDKELQVLRELKENKENKYNEVLMEVLRVETNNIWNERYELMERLKHHSNVHRRVCISIDSVLMEIKILIS